MEKGIYYNEKHLYMFNFKHSLDKIQQKIMLDSIADFSWYVHVLSKITIINHRSILTQAKIK